MVLEIVRDAIELESQNKEIEEINPRNQRPFYIIYLFIYKKLIMTIIKETYAD
jgi:hypothetical protein